MVVVLVVVFTAVIRIQIDNFWAFLISGFFVWNYISGSLYAATYTLAEHAQITRSIALPNEALIVSAALSKLVEFLAELLLVLAVLAVALHHRLPASFITVPVLLVIQFFLTLGLQLPVATLAVFYKDVQHALPLLLSALFYLSPVFYPASMIPEQAQSYYFINPVAQLLTLYQQVLYEGRFPALDLLASVSLKTAVILALGLLVFNRFKHLFAEIL
jgi:ABC-type polysaccharide/polyol phosphate export permease